MRQEMRTPHYTTQREGVPSEMAQPEDRIEATKYRESRQPSMRVFISWSGDTSNQVAEALSRWLPMVLQQVKCFFSPKDIEKGARWALRMDQLEGASVGVLCLTRENLGAPWMLFEAGAMSRALQTSNVCPLLFGLEPNDVAGPLAQFQSSTFSKDEVRKLIQTINGKLESPLDATSLETIFEKWWPDLESAVQQLLARTPSSKPGPRPTAEVLDEVLSLVRSIRPLSSLR